MNINIYRRAPKHPRTRNAFEKTLELILKSIILFTLPAFVSAPISWLWYHFLYRREIFFDGKMEGIVTCAWITTFSLLYAMITALILNTVWNEFKAMREAIKEGPLGIISFMKLRDEKVSPLIYMVIHALSAFILVAFMVLKYPSALGGIATVSATSYVFMLVMRIIKEVDNPCHGLWYIRRIPDLWLTIDADEFYKKLHVLKNGDRQNIDKLKKLIEDCQIKTHK